jgi:hypothetical protein
MAKKFVAFLDILGFKDLVENNSSDELTKIYIESLNAMYHSSVGFWVRKNNDPNLEYTELKSIIISDTIIIWAEYDNPASFIKLLITVKAILAISFITGIPLRGTIEYDEISILDPVEVSKYAINNTMIILGKAITNAYQQEQMQNWAGCIVSKNAIEYFESIVTKSQDNSVADIKYLLSINILILYKAPMKSGKISDHYCINWAYVEKQDSEKVLDEEYIRKSFSKYNKRVDSWNVELIIKNTLDFYNYSKKNKPLN